MLQQLELFFLVGSAQPNLSAKKTMVHSVFKISQELYKKDDLDKYFL